MLFGYLVHNVLVPIFPNSSGWTLSSVFKTYFGNLYYVPSCSIGWDVVAYNGQGCSTSWDVISYDGQVLLTSWDGVALPLRLNLPILSTTSSNWTLCSNEVAISFSWGGDGFTKGDSNDWSKIGTPLQYFIHYQNYGRTLHG